LVELIRKALAILWFHCLDDTSFNSACTAEFNQVARRDIYRVLQTRNLNYSEC